VTGRAVLRPTCPILRSIEGRGGTRMGPTMLRDSSRRHQFGQIAPYFPWRHRDSAPARPANGSTPWPDTYWHIPPTPRGEISLRHNSNLEPGRPAINLTGAYVQRLRAIR